MTLKFICERHIRKKTPKGLTNDVTFTKSEVICVLRGVLTCK